LTADQPGCLSGFVIPPLAVILVAAVLSSAAFRFSSTPTLPPLAAHATGQLSAVFTPEVQHWGAAIMRWAADSGLDPNLIAVVMQIESCGDPFAKSTAGALGLFQVMPYHFTDTEEPFFPDTNAARGLAYLSRALNASNADVRLTLAGYNGGLGLIGAPESSWPAESLRYVYWGAGIYADATAGATHSDRLDEWLAAGGERLCDAAGLRLNTGS
jgi:soluble lytic murein transglycosylase-like protein